MKSAVSNVAEILFCRQTPMVRHFCRYCGAPCPASFGVGRGGGVGGGLSANMLLHFGMAYASLVLLSILATPNAGWFFLSKNVPS